MVARHRPSHNAIETKALTKHYGSDRGIVNLDLEVRRGEVFGFLGPNGAGKSTTINVLMDFRKPSTGHARILGQDAHTNSAVLHRQIGYMPGELFLYENLTGRQLITYLGNLHGGIDHSYVETLVQRLDIEMDRKINQLSKGNKQKLGLLQAWAHQPEVFILDEPTSGLDPMMQHEFYRLVAEARKAGKTVFMSSHVMSEAEHVCDRVGIIREGQLVAVEQISSLHERSLRHLEIRFSAKPPRDALAEVAGVRNRRIEGETLYCSVTGSMDPVVKALAKYKIHSLTSEHASLEEIFFAEYQDA